MIDWKRLDLTFMSIIEFLTERQVTVFLSSQPKVGRTVIYKVFLSHTLENQLNSII